MARSSEGKDMILEQLKFCDNQWRQKILAFHSQDQCQGVKLAFNWMQNVKYPISR